MRPIEREICLVERPTHNLRVSYAFIDNRYLLGYLVKRHDPDFAA
jgi:hypothetical protein